MTTYLLNTESTYKTLQPFKSIEDHNANIAAIREQFNDQLTKSEKEVLDVLSRYSAKYFGLSYLSKSKIAEMIGISRRTVIRACLKFEQLGFIKQYKLKRAKGDKRQSTNAIVFVDVTPQCHTELSHQEALPKAPEKTNRLKDNTYPEALQCFYSHFKQRIVSMIGKVDQNLISKLFGIYKAQSIKMLRFSIYTDKVSELEALSMQALSITLKATQNKPIRSLTGFYSGVYSRLIERHIIGIERSYMAVKSHTELEWFMPSYRTE
ncbi:helix-turn-helix domain-containing protein [Sporosarcina saromensis]|uniref:Helix-turn-helix domain-containing protein n=1 Tax=Sporosarcina saromensis TaxID=359365 RepID=A0ABU4G5D8_9BACL|nr:helix-turn-helix domain-containing protein [Sporosarcina saromensis]MDW0112189.1 helix-turn-helix domain-containing protein [Sporosarcina saromensis]